MPLESAVARRFSGVLGVGAGSLPAFFSTGLAAGAAWGFGSGFTRVGPVRMAWAAGWIVTQPVALRRVWIFAQPSLASRMSKLSFLYTTSMARLSGLGLRRTWVQGALMVTVSARATVPSSRPNSKATRSLRMVTWDAGQPPCATTLRLATLWAR